MKPTTDMTSSNEENRHRMAGLLELCPWLADGRGRRLLYVGAMPTRQDFLAELLAWGWKVDILEAWAPYHKELLAIEGVHQVHIGNVRDATELPTGRYAVCFWWHGPEHLEANDTAIALRNLEGLATLAVVVGMPYGQTGSGATEGNHHNEHRSAWYGPDIEALGYRWKLTTVGYRNLSAVKIMGEK